MRRVRCPRLFSAHTSISTHESERFKDFSFGKTHENKKSRLKSTSLTITSFPGGFSFHGNYKANQSHLRSKLNFTAELHTRLPNKVCLE